MLYCQQKHDKEDHTSRISLPEGQIDDIDKCYKYLRTLQSFDNNDYKVSCKSSKYRSLVRQVLRNKLTSKNEVIAINNFTVLVIQYSPAVVCWRQKITKRNRHIHKSL